MIDTSIVISMYNATQDILVVLERLLFPSLCQNASPNKELILLDDYSPLRAQTNALVHKFKVEFTARFGQFIYTQNSRNLGFAASYNRGIGLARGEYIVLANSDLYFPQDAIDALCHALRANPAYGIVGPVTNGKVGFQHTRLFKNLSDYSLDEIARIENFARWLKRAMPQRYLENVDLLGFCLCCKREVFEKSGYFDTRFKAGSMEDVDLIVRAKKYYVVALDCSTFVEHGGVTGQSLSLLQGKSPRNFLYFVFINPARYLLKWGPSPKIARGLFRGFIQYATGTHTVTSYIGKMSQQHLFGEVEFPNNSWE
jgi:GT2 family glycosyltransferase